MSSHRPWRPSTVATFVILMRLFFVFLSRSEKASILEHFGQGPAAGGGAPTLRSLVAPSKEGPADIYIYIYIYSDERELTAPEHFTQAVYSPPIAILGNYRALRAIFFVFFSFWVHAL